MANDPEFTRITQSFQKEMQFQPGRKLEELQDLRKTSEDGPVKTWSFSTRSDFETCPHRVYLSKVKRCEHPPPGRALVRGTLVHDMAEKYVTGEIDTIAPELERFSGQLKYLRGLYEQGEVECEDEWGFTKEWDSVPWDAPDLWGKMKLDALIRSSEDSAIVIDYKTGKKKGNEIKHTDQGIVYAIGTMMRYPKVHFVQVEFWYTDEGEKLIKKYTRNELQHLLPRQEERAYRVTTCQDFPPNPSQYACRWCPHAQTGACEFAY